MNIWCIELQVFHRKYKLNFILHQHMRNWLQFWEEKSKQQEAFEQVGRVGGIRAQTGFLKTYAEYIAEKLDLTQEDVLLDMCCGNGLLTQYLAPFCKKIVGVDFSAGHIQYAQRHHAPKNATYYEGNALELNRLEGLNSIEFTKATLFFSFQYFESMQIGQKVVEQLKSMLPEKGVIFLADIPDKDRWLSYYNTPVKLLRLFKQYVFSENDMGKFWSIRELDTIARNCNAKGEKIPQPREFPYAHYRMDYRIQL